MDTVDVASIEIEVLAEPVVSFAAQQNDMPILRRVKITNVSQEVIESSQLSIDSQPAFADALTLPLARLAPGDAVDIEPVPLRLSPQYLMALSESLTGHLEFVVACEQRVLGKVTHALRVLAKDEWAGLIGLPDFTAALVLPNHPAVERVLGAAALILNRLDPLASLSGYQSKEAKAVVLQCCAIFLALKKLDLKYLSPPASFEKTGQKVRFPERILENKLAACLDLSLFFAACLEQAGLNPLVALVPGHAFVGVWLRDETFPDAFFTHWGQIKNRLDLGELLFVEATHLCNGGDADFKAAVRAASGRMKNSEAFHGVFDIKRCRNNGVRPLPLPGQEMPARTKEDARPTADAARSPVDDEALGDLLPMPPPPAEELPQTPAGRLERWKSKLLDLSLNNRLLNFKENKKTIRLLCPTPAALEDKLAEGVSFQISPKPSVAGGRVRQDATAVDIEEAFFTQQIASNRLYGDHSDEELERRLLDLYRAARLSLEESGANTLYGAFGVLEWYESTASNTPRYAPLLLLPMELKRGSIKDGFRLRRGDDEARVNTTLLEHLRKSFGVEVAGLDPLPTDQSGVDVVLIFNRFRQAIKATNRWNVREEVWIGLFFFSKYLMWKELQDREADILRNKLVKHLVETPKAHFPAQGGFPRPEELDASFSPKDTFCPLPADSSQLSAVHYAAQGNTCVIEGPPGTGKSQTITNLIAHCLAQGKRILFVAEKAAALNVVHSRLKKIGLEPFTLELHSNKATKRHVLEQLRTRVPAPQTATVAFSQVADRVEKLRSYLNAYPEALHRVRDIGVSAFTAWSRWNALRDAPKVALAWPPGGVSCSGLQTLLAQAQEAASLAGQVGRPSQHPWNGAALEEWSLGLASNLPGILDGFAQSIETLKTCGRALWRVLALPDFTPESMNLCAQVVQALRTDALSGFLFVQNHDESLEGLRTYVELYSSTKALERALFDRLYESALDLDLLALENALVTARASWFYKRWKLRKGVQNALSTHGKTEENIPRAELGDLVAQLQRVKKQRGALAESADKHCRLLGRFRLEDGPNFMDIANAAENARRLRRLAQKAAQTLDVPEIGAIKHWAQLLPCAPDSSPRRAVLSQAWQAFKNALEQFKERRSRIKEALVLDVDMIFGPWTDAAYLDHAAAWALQGAQHVPKLQHWCAWRKTATQAENVGLGPLLQDFDAGNLAPSDFVGSIEHFVYEKWTIAAIDSEPALRTFLSSEFERRREDFKTQDDRYIEASQQAVVSRVAARMPALDQGAVHGERAVLDRELLLQRSRKSIRGLLSEIPNLVAHIKPCFLMSPMSVAQYLAPGIPDFDVVVFDEASQMPTWDAIGAASRGKETIIVGDRKQLPPTAFFQRIDAADGDDEDNIQELESILDECSAANLPSLRLRWHYRSRHESLIAFSNRLYYNNELLTFPSPHITAGVKFHFVSGGVYDRGRSKTNDVEARALVADIVSRLKDPARNTRSIGVVTFSQPQQRRVEDLLEVARRDNPEIDVFFSDDVLEPVFVKNLENVQGDERDVIMFSICYGPDEAGKLAMNFGPLNKQGGERRLNVAVTRAKYELLVFSSIRAEHIDLTRAQSAGVRDFKLFLDFAARGRDALREETRTAPTDDFDSPFEAAVAHALKKLGHDVHTQVGCSGYRIDLAIVDPAKPGRYLLGIECDGANYHSAKTARDRDKLREAVLRDLGWRLHRIWSSDWFNAPQSCLQKVEAALELATRESLQDQANEAPTPCIAEAPLPDRVIAAVSSESELHQEPNAALSSIDTHPASPSCARGLKRYELAPDQGLVGTKEVFYLPAAAPRIQELTLTIAALEGPVSIPRVGRYVGKHFGLSNLKSRGIEHIRGLAARANIWMGRFEGVFFLASPGFSLDDWETFRIPGDAAESERSVEDICPAEIANAALHILKGAVAIERTELVRQTARLFGIQRVGANVERRIDAALESLLGRRARLDGDKLVLQHRDER